MDQKEFMQAVARFRELGDGRAKDVIGSLASLRGVPTGDGRINPVQRNEAIGAAMVLLQSALTLDVGPCPSSLEVNGPTVSCEHEAHHTGEHRGTSHPRTREESAATITWT